MDEPTVRDKLREMKWRHAAGVDTEEFCPGDERDVRDDDGLDEHEKVERRHTAEEISSSESEEADVGDMLNKDEEAL